MNYMWLDPEQCCWSTMAAAVYKTQYVFGVSLTKWEAYLLGGKSSQHDQSTRSIIELQTNVRKNFTFMEKAPTRAFSWLKVPIISAITFITQFRHYAKQAPKHNILVVS